MEGFQGFEAEFWNPFSIIDIDNKLLYLNKETLIATWAVLLVLAISLFIFRYFLKYKNGIIRYLLVQYVQQFKDLTSETLGSFQYNHFVFITTIFTFILLCNWIAILPFVEEPTKDLNTTLALGITAFIYKEYYAIQSAGLLAYIKEFFHPFFLMFPLNVIGHLSKVISMSFRLFGNIFGGSIISMIYLKAISSNVLLELAGIITGFNFGIIFFFILFEGLIQAFVFAMLSLAYLSIAIQASHEEESF